MTDQQEALLLAVLDHPQHAEQIVEWASEPGNLDSLADDDEPEHVQLAHAPAGGVTTQGRQFKGGEFIPGDVLDRATPAEKAAISGDSPAGKPHPSQSVPGLSEDAQKPENAGTVKRVWKTAKLAAQNAVARVSALASKHAPDVLLEAADFAKITFSAPGTNVDPVKGALGISANDAALIASHVLGRVALWAKRKITGNPEARLSHEEAPDVGALADVLIDTLRTIGERLGIPANLPEREAVMVKLADRLQPKPPPPSPAQLSLAADMEAMETRLGEQINAALAKQPAPVINVTIPQTPVSVNVEPPTVNVHPPAVHVAAPPPAEITVNVEQPAAPKGDGKRVEFQRYSDGSIKSATIKED